jgi:hypothetical protein
MFDSNNPILSLGVNEHVVITRAMALSALSNLLCSVCLIFSRDVSISQIFAPRSMKNAIGDHLPLAQELQLVELHVAQLEPPFPPLICTVVKICRMELLLHFGHFTLLFPEILVNTSNGFPHFLHLNS